MCIRDRNSKASIQFSTISLRSTSVGRYGENRGGPFFVCGKGNSLHPALEAGSTEGLKLLDRIIDEGHWVGNHSLSHSVELGTTNNKLLIEQEIGGNEEIIKEYNQHKLFRPYMAGGIISPKIFSQEAVDFLCLNKYTLVLFNVLPKDWENAEKLNLKSIKH